MFILKHRTVVLSILLILTWSRAAWATCEANVSASVSGTTLTVNASGGGTCGDSSISSVFLDNTLIGSQSCPGSTCSVSLTRSTTCLRSGTHTVTATHCSGESATAQQAVSIPLNQPTVPHVLAFAAP